MKYVRLSAPTILTHEVGTSGDNLTDWSAKNPYTSTITDNHILTGKDSKKETRHIVFDLGKSGLTYKAGDALGVIPVTSSELVDDVLGALGVDADQIVETHVGDVSLREALSQHYEIHQATKKFIINLGSKFNNGESQIEIRLVKRTRSSTSSGLETEQWSWSGEADDYPSNYSPTSTIIDPAHELWNKLTQDDKAMEDYLWGRDYIDVLSDFGHLGITGQEFVDSLGRLKPRLYSIASSPDFEAGTVHLTVAIVRYEGQGRSKTGLTTGYLADRISVGDGVEVFMSPTRSFILPEDGANDIIMVGPGTGIAPFRAFLQQRKVDESKGRNWLFFGDWTEEGEFLYRDEIQSYVKDGTIDQLDLAWSREGPSKVYVQHLMEENGAEIWNWLDNGGYFYVCGDKNRMARDVHSTLIQICSQHGGMSDEDAKHYVERTLMKDEKRYLRDVY